MERGIWEHPGIESPALLRCHGETFRRRVAPTNHQTTPMNGEIAGWQKPCAQRWQHGKQSRLVAGLPADDAPCGGYNGLRSSTMEAHRCLY